MAIKVIAQRREVKLGKTPGMKFVMRPDLYIPIAEKKVFSEAATHSGISAGVIKAALIQINVWRLRADVWDYEEQAILGCAVEGDSSSHHGGRHGAGNHELYGIRTDYALGVANELKSLHSS